MVLERKKTINAQEIRPGVGKPFLTWAFVSIVFVTLNVSQPLSSHPQVHDGDESTHQPLYRILRYKVGMQSPSPPSRNHQCIYPKVLLNRARILNKGMKQRMRSSSPHWHHAKG